MELSPLLGGQCVYDAAEPRTDDRAMTHAAGLAAGVHGGPGGRVRSEFEPFRRIEARTGVRDGAGLGLSIARSVVTAHRATVTGRSQPEGGLDISVVIPQPQDLAAESQP